MIVIKINITENFALGHKTRRDILSKLKKEMNATELSHVLKKPITTIRHHLDILVNAKLVERTKLIEKRGSFVKYYKTDYILKEVKSK